MDDLQAYDYELPPELIAGQPLAQRDAARLLVIDRQTGTLSHHHVRDLPDLLNPGDCLVLNNTRVIPARLVGYRTATSGKWEGLFLGTTPSGNWRLLTRSRGKLLPNEQITVVPVHRRDSGESLQFTVIEREPDGTLVVQPASSDDHLRLLEQFGTVPLPPYIERDVATADDWDRYQTTFARQPGAVAAPTAGLHFTPELLARCAERGIRTAWVTLHVGVGTFRPIATQNLSEHRMHAEWCEIGAEAVEMILHTQAAGRRVVAIGTTAVRTLETAAGSGTLSPFVGDTELFIRPPYQFRVVDALLTNFHLPRTTLLVLVSTFAGHELIKAAYQSAIAERYRFYSYGDAMLIL